MPYSKFLIVASKLDKAGINITTQLSQFGEYKFYLVDKEIIYTENLDLEKIKQVAEYHKDHLSFRKIEKLTGIPKSTIHYLIRYAERSKVKSGKQVVYL